MEKEYPSSFSAIFQKLKALFLPLVTWAKRKKRLPAAVTTFLVIIPILGTIVLGEIVDYQYDREIAFSKRKSVAGLGTILVKERLDKVIDVGDSLASRPLVQQYTEDGKWEDAIKNLKNIPTVFPYVEMVMLTDPQGILRASAPSMGDLAGKDLSDLEYFKEAIKARTPYVSDMLSKLNDPDCSYFSVAIPIRTDLDKKLLGVLVLNVNLAAFTDWHEDIDVGLAGNTHILDRKGIPLVRADSHSSDGLPDQSFILELRSLEDEEQQVREWFDPILNDTQVVAYETVPLYNMGVVVTQPSRIIFMDREEEVARRMVLWACLVLFLGIFVYLTLRRRNATRDACDKEEKFLESMGDGVVAINREWRITFWNRAASIITGWTKKEALGKPLRSFLKFIKNVGHIEDYSFIEDAVVSGNVTTVAKNSSLVKKDGSEISVGDSASPIINDHGEAEGAVIIFRDTSKEVESERLRSDFSYATHQLRTPVTEAVWNLELAMSEIDAEKRKEDLEIVHNSLASVKELTEHLVEVSALDQGNVAPQLSMVKLVDLFTEVQNKAEKEAIRRDITISISPVSALAAVRTDQKLLGRILFEVIENAILYGLAKSTVNVKVNVLGKELVVEVVNVGRGISEEEQPLIFTKFFRGSNKGAKDVGAGLGLFIAREYVKVLKGKIWFTSQESGETRFYISIPVE